jgi:hypothetical protein
MTASRVNGHFETNMLIQITTTAANIQAIRGRHRLNANRREMNAGKIFLAGLWIAWLIAVRAIWECKANYLGKELMVLKCWKFRERNAFFPCLCCPSGSDMLIPQNGIADSGSRYRIALLADSDPVASACPAMHVFQSELLFSACALDPALLVNRQRVLRWR